MGSTAKTFGKAPSDYLPELGSYEAFCLDEACAYALAIEQERRMEEAREERQGEGKARPKEPSGNALDFMMNDKFKG